MSESRDDESVRDARARYFRDNDFGDGGGYDARIVKLKAGPISFGFPNTASRVRAVRFHDLHHILTGYATTWTGEAEISAWEIAGSCADHTAAWILNLGAMTVGLVIAPRRVFRAFVRGRQSRNLYRETFREELLDTRVGDLRLQLGLSERMAPARAADVAWFGAWLLACVGYNAVAFAILAAPVWLAVRAVAS